MEMMEDSLPRVTVVGCGHWGKNLVRNFAALGALRFVVDPDKRQAREFARQHKVRLVDWETALYDERADSVVIAAPATRHARLAREALEANKHVFVEKPLALDVEEAKALCVLAEEKKRRLMVGHLLQYHPAFNALEGLVRRGQLGKLRYIYSHRLSFGKIRTEEDVWWSFAPHDISMILRLTECEPEQVKAVGSFHLNDHIADVTTTHLRFPDNIQAHVFVSWLHPYKDQKLVVIGENGMAVFNDTLPWAEKLLFYPHRVDIKDGVPMLSKAEMVPVKLEEDEPLLCECRHFLECVATGKTPRSDGYEGVRVLSVLDAAAADLERRRTGGPS